MISIEDLREHLERGGAATLNHPATYAVAEGSVIAPARYAGRTGSEFIFETRYVDTEFVTTVLIDSKGSQSNRSEDGLVTARREGGVAAKVPAIEVDYPSRSLLDMELPHRAFDAHVRASSQDGNSVVQQDWYKALRDCTEVDLSPLFARSPVTLAYGGWDSSRKSGQLRLRSHYVSELFGVVDGTDPSRRSGARLDPLGQDFHVTPDEYEALLERQRDEMSSSTVEKLEKEIEKARKKGSEATVSAAALNLGGVPPGTEEPFGVSVPEVRRARTYSLAGLRRLRFGGSPDDDVAAREALLALLLLGAAYADADPEIRAYCDISAPAGELLLDDEPLDLDLSIPACESYLEEAVGRLPERLAWQGQVQRVEGDPSLDRGAVADEE